MQPHYSIPPHLLISLALDVLRNKPRSFRRDAEICAGVIQPPICYIGLESIPSYPCLITINHYSRPGFQAWWLALGVSAALSAEVHWLITAAWTFPGRPWAEQAERVSGWVLRRLAGLYGFTTMPPMPPRPEEVLVRAHSVRRLLGSVRHGQAGWIGIAPEGQDTPGGALGEPPAGSGRFLLLLANLGLEFLPAVIYEQQGRITIRFGAPYHLQVSPDLSASERDRKASRLVMLRLAEMLPENLHGAYHQALKSQRLE